jgi:hypothetical protein
MDITIMKTRKLLAILATIPLFLFSACASLGDDLFVAGRLSDTAKASALTQEGIERYNNELVAKAAYDKLDDVRKYFVVALRYDPDAPRARQYLEKLDDFRDTTVRQKLKDAARLLAKPKRTEAEDIALVSAVRVAESLDPRNDAVAKMVKDTAQVRTALVDSLVARAEAADAKATAAANAQKGAPSGATLENLYADAYAIVAKAQMVDPGNGKVSRIEARVHGNLAKLVSTRADSAKKLADTGKYEAASAEVDRITVVNRKAAYAFSPERAKAAFYVNYRWAKNLYEKKDYRKAEQKIDAALAVGKSSDAVALKKKIADGDEVANRSASFETAIAEIDRLLGKGDLVSARRRIDAAARSTKESAKLDQLDGRRDKLAALLKGVYESGVAAYRAENFKEAIDALDTVVGVDADYEEASDYLAKAKEKQRLLDQFTSGS